MDQNFHDLLDWFGFTEKERETYATILQKGPTTIQEIVESSEVSRRHVYNIIEKLEQYQFIIKNNYITPTTIEPNPPEEVHHHVQEQANELFQYLDTQYQQGRDIIDDVKVLKSRSTVIKKIKEMISSAEYRIAISIPVDFLPTLRDVLADAVERGVAVLVLLCDDENPNNAVPDVSLDGVANAIRYRSEEISILIAIDCVSALVSPRHIVTKSFTQTNAIFLGQPYLEPVVFTSLMNTEWVNGEELFIDSPRELPHSYESFPRAVVDAALYRQNGVSLWAEIDAQPRNDSESLVEVSGNIVDISQRFVQPVTSPLPGQTTITVDTADGERSIGGKDGYLEDYRAYLTTLKRTK